MYSCIDLLPVHLDSHGYVERWKAWLDAIYHVYMDNWSPSVGDEFELEIEELNRHNRYAMSIKFNGDILGNVGFSMQS